MNVEGKVRTKDRAVDQDCFPFGKDEALPALRLV